MKKFILFFLLGYLFAHGIKAQIVTVVDNTNLQPLSGVVLKSEKPLMSVVTNAKGQADIRGFKGSTLIVVTHVNYLPKAYTYEELSKQEFKIALSEKAYSMSCKIRETYWCKKVNWVVEVQ